MDALEAIVTRRSTRNYKPDAVEAEKLDLVLKAAGQAPSGGNNQHNHFLVIRNRDVIQKLIDLAEKRCVLVACAGGTGRGTLECLTQLERGLTHMGMRAYDRIPVVRYNRDYILPALYEAGKTYAERLETGFDMYY